MKIAIELNKQNIITGHLYLVSENYNGFDNLTVIDVESEADIIPYKTKYENGELSYLDDYCAEYYAQQNAEAQRQELQNQLAELYAWFDEYDNQIKQYERDVRLGTIAPYYHIGEMLYTIEELDGMARAKATEITSIRNQIKVLE